MNIYPSPGTESVRQFGMFSSQKLSRYVAVSRWHAFCMSVNLCGIYLAVTSLIWGLTWRILWTVSNESASFEGISHVQICGSAFTIFVTADMLSSFASVFGQPRGVTAFLPLFLEWDPAILWWWHVKKLWTLWLSPNLYESSVCCLWVLVEQNVEVSTVLAELLHFLV